MTDYIFQESSNGIKFIGDFESFYQNENDPCEQSASQNKGNTNEMANFYEISRQKLLDFLLVNFENLSKLVTMSKLLKAVMKVTQVLLCA